MKFELATKNDLQNIKKVFAEIVKTLLNNKIFIWDSAYPNNVFEEDIELSRLYVLKENDVIIAAFALCADSTGEDSFSWQDKNAKALYLYRLGVNVEYLNSGYGKFALEQAIEISGALGADYLRLLVADSNPPAIKLYEKCGFALVEGIFYQPTGNNVILNELGYEIKV